MLVYDYPSCYLTLGEIGCALSHQKIYKKMVDDDIVHALVLEDDVAFSDEFVKYLCAIDSYLAKNYPIDMACIMYSAGGRYFKNLSIDIDGIKIHKASSFGATHAYIITKISALKFIKANTPIILEADMWLYFSKLTGVKNLLH